MSDQTRRQTSQWSASDCFHPYASARRVFICHLTHASARLAGWTEDHDALATAQREIEEKPAKALKIASSLYWTQARKHLSSRQNRLDFASVTSAWLVLALFGMGGFFFVYNYAVDPPEQHNWSLLVFAAMVHLAGTSAGASQLLLVRGGSTIDRLVPGLFLISYASVSLIAFFHLDGFLIGGLNLAASVSALLLAFRSKANIGPLRNSLASALLGVVAPLAALAVVLSGVGFAVCSAILWAVRKRLAHLLFGFAIAQNLTAQDLTFMATVTLGVASSAVVLALLGAAGLQALRLIRVLLGRLRPFELPASLQSVNAVIRFYRHDESTLKLVYFEAG